ncbi:MAG: hypothetical protein J0H74_35425 [Chitinophagaceae bacterium]|nr:hypothetical protein [Chitinophagaceae bacterium]
MRKVYLTCLGIISAGVIYAQSYEGKIDYQKTQQPVAVVQLSCSKTTVEDGLSEYMAKKGAKRTGVKSFTVFRSVRLNDADTALTDLYFMMEPKSRQEKDITLLTLLPVRKNQDILTRPAGDNTLVPAARSFLDSLAPALEAYSIRVHAGTQEALLQKARKKLNGLINDQVDLEKKIRGLEADIDENKKEQAKQASDLRSNIKSDDDAKKKNQRKLQKLMDSEGRLDKKLRNAKSDLDQNKIDQRQQQAEVDKQQQILDGIKARQGQPAAQG